LSASSNKLKQFRRLATRYDKLLANFMGFVKLAAIAIWLKELNRHYGLASAQGFSARSSSLRCRKRSRRRGTQGSGRYSPTDCKRE
jgi:hypothetical protein